MTKAEKIFKDSEDLREKQQKLQREQSFERIKINEKLIFTGKDYSRDEPLIALVIANQQDVDINGAKPILGLKVRSSHKYDDIAIEGFQELLKFRDWLEDLLSNAVIQEMKEIKDSK